MKASSRFESPRRRGSRCSTAGLLLVLSLGQVEPGGLFSLAPVRQLSAPPEIRVSGTPRASDGELGAASFVLDSVSTESLWPAAEHWCLYGIRFTSSLAGKVLLEVCDARFDNRQLGWTTTSLRGAAVDVVIAYRPKDVARRGGNLIFYQVEDRSVSMLGEFEVSDRYAPRCLTSLSPGWNGGKAVSSGEFRTLGLELATWSWNGPNTERVVHAIPVTETIIESAEERELLDNWRKTPVRDWPDAVWFIRIAYSVAPRR